MIEDAKEFDAKYIFVPLYIRDIEEPDFGESRSLSLPNFESNDALLAEINAAAGNIAAQAAAINRLAQKLDAGYDLPNLLSMQEYVSEVADFKNIRGKKNDWNAVLLTCDSSRADSGDLVGIEVAGVVESLVPGEAVDEISVCFSASELPED